MKYTRFLSRGNIGEVDLEWQFAQLVSTYNCALEADCAHPCCMTNASLYTYYPLADSYENNKPAETIEYDKQVRYFTIYIGGSRSLLRMAQIRYPRLLEGRGARNCSSHMGT